MGTGTDSGGAYRLTPARRFTLAGLTLVMVATAMMIAPTAARAADEWYRMVRHYSEPCGAGGNVSSSVTIYQNSPSDEGSASMAFDENDATRWVADDPAGGRTVSVSLPSAMAICGIRILSWANDSSGGDPYHVQALTDTNCAAAGGLSLPPSGTSEQLLLGEGGTSLTMVDTGVVEWEITAQCFRFAAVAPGASGGWRVYSIDIFSDPGASVIENCQGFAGPNGDDGLVFSILGTPPEGLDPGRINAWGDDVVENSEPTSSCDYNVTSTYVYTPPEGITEGDTHLFAADIAAGNVSSGGVTWLEGGTTGVIEFSWVGSSGGVSWTARNAFTDGNNGPSDGTEERLSNAPPGATAIRIKIWEGTRLHSLTLANVEGNPSLDSGDDGTGPTTGPGLGIGSDPFAHCVPGADFLAVGEWVAYAACLIAALPGAIVGLLVTALEWLFVPQTLGAQWAAFMAFIETRVPFGWFSQVVDTIESGASAGADVLGSFTLNVGSASVSIGAGISTALAGVAPYRGLIFAGVALVMVMGCLRWIMASVGVSPGGGGHAEGSG